MKTIALAQATAPLAEYARRIEEGPVVLTVRGRPVGALVPIQNADAESIALGTNPDFMAMIENSRRRQRREGGIPEAEVRRRLGLTAKPRKRRWAKDSP